MTKHYDYFVIGAGSGGVRSARIAAQHGATVGVAEASALGGTCVNLGCVPKKLLAYASDYGFHMEDAKGFGWEIPEGAQSNWPALIEAKNREISRLNGIYQNLFDKAGVTLHRGFAKFIDSNTVEVHSEDGSVETITADKFLIAVGGTPRKAQHEGAEHVIVSDDAFFLPELPKEILIVGGGYVGVEFAHIMHGMGAHVTLIYRGDLFLRGFDDTIRLALAEEMRKSGIELHFKCDIESVEKHGERLTVSTTSGHEIETDVMLSAIGRVPKIDGLGLEAAGVATDRGGFITVNDQYETSQSHIHALGDVTNAPKLTPVAIQEGHVLADRLFGNQPERSVNYENIATAVFSYPPLATVGMAEEEALAAGYDIEVFKSDFRPMKHTLSGRDERSVMKLIVDQATDKVLGLHMMGLDAPEIMQGFAIALNCGATKADFDRTMAMHPTAAEEFVTMRTGMKMNASEMRKIG